MSSRPVEVGLYLPQVALEPEAIVEKALAAEAAGFHSLWLYDHLYSPGQPDHDSFEALDGGHLPSGPYRAAAGRPSRARQQLPPPGPRWPRW